MARRRSLSACFVAFALTGTSPLATAQPGGVDADQLAAQATDPTAQLMSFQLSDWYTASHHGIDDTANQVVLRAVLPFDLGQTRHIFRVTQPYATSSPAGRGLVDTTVFDLVVFDQAWGRWGLGVAGTLPTGASGLSTDKWTAGPAGGFVNSSNKAFNWGVFVQSFFSFAGARSAPDVGIVNVQPIFSVPLGNGRSLSLGNSAFVYDTEKSRWASLLLGVNYGQVVTWAGHKWRPNVELDYDFRDLFGNQRWVVRAGISLLLPR